jgi:hypothetical protein
MTNEHAPYAIVEFITSNSLSKSLLRDSGNLISLNSDNWAKFATQNNWKIVTFMNPNERISLLLYPTISELADIFESEKDMAFGLVNCTGNFSFCKSLNVRAAPIVRVYNGPVWKDYEGYRELEFLLPWVNKECGKRRRIDGSLEVRRPIEGFERTLRNFLNDGNRTRFMEEFKVESEEEDVYIPAMRKIAKNGIEGIDADIENCVKLLGNAKLKGEPRVRVEEQLYVLRQIKKIVEETKHDREL